MPEMLFPIKYTALILFFLLISFPSTITCQNLDFEPIDDALKAFSKIDSFSLMASSLVFVGDPTAFLTSASAKMFQYFKYLDISYSEDYYQRMLVQRYTSVSLDFGIDMSNTAKIKFSQSDSPEVFVRYRPQTGFIVSFWQSFTTLTIIFGIYLLIWVLEQLGLKKKIPCISSPITHKVRISFQNLFYIIFYDAYPEIVFFSLIDFISTKVKSGYDGLSFCLSVFALIGGGLLIKSHLMLLLKRNKLLKQTGELAQKELAIFYQKYDSLQIVYKRFKTNTGLQQICFFIIMTRAILSSIIVAALYEHPVVQVLFLILLNVLMIVYILKTLPFTDKLNYIQQLTYETIYLSMNVCALIVSIMDGVEDLNMTVREHVGRYLVVVNVIFNLLVLLSLMVKIYLVLRDKFKPKPIKMNSNLSINAPSLQTSEKIKPKSAAESQNPAYIYKNNPVKSGQVNRQFIPKITINPPNDINNDSVNQSGYSDHSFISKERQFTFMNVVRHDIEANNKYDSGDSFRGTQTQMEFSRALSRKKDYLLRINNADSNASSQHLESPMFKKLRLEGMTRNVPEQTQSIFKPLGAPQSDAMSLSQSRADVPLDAHQETIRKKQRR